MLMRHPAGMCVQELRQRAKVLDLIEDCRQRTGWPVAPLGAELQGFWQSSEDVPNG